MSRLGFGSNEPDNVIVLAQSAVAAVNTGNTTENTLATVTLPAGIMGLNGRIEIVALFSGTGSTGKNIKIRFGGTSVFAVQITTSISTAAFTQVANRNSASSQVGHCVSQAFGAASAALAFPTIDTAADVSITITGQNQLAGDTITLESYIIKVYPKP